VKVAIVGAGISGLTAAFYLQRRHRVVLFEAEDRPGGHTNTVDVQEEGRSIPVDTGFIVFNTRTYPGFVRLLGELGVDWTGSDMSFSVSSARRDFEYASRGLSGLFAQGRHLVSPRFLRMLWELSRFHREARALVDASREGEPGADQPLAAWLAARGFSDDFGRDHLYPLVRAVWSANQQTAERFPARFLARFLDNHGLLRLADDTRWLTIPGGARTYVRALLAAFRGELRLSAGVRSVRRNEAGAVVSCEGAPPEQFDHVVLACHSDQALALLADPSEVEQQVLSALPYQQNEAVLHTDESVMPVRRRAWASWNVHLDDEGADGACVTYWMNRLQPLGATRNYFVTLNGTQQLRAGSILRVQRYAHPLFTPAGVAAQARHGELIGHRHTSYAGAYWRNGFHEDGVASALRVVDRLDGGLGEGPVRAGGSSLAAVREKASPTKMAA
jgi:predicted NAD/FAD-binding protein